MATLHKGIITTAGLNLFNRVQAGNTQISYTKVVFCDAKNVLNMEDQDIRDLKDVNAENELKTEPEAYDNGLVTGKGGVTATEVDVRAVVDNQHVTAGFYPYVSALYASDGNQEILYGLVLDDKPGYLPPFDGFTPQPLIFNWRLFTATTDDFNLDDDHDVYATIADLKGVEGKYKEFADQGTADLNNYKASLSSSLSTAYSGVASSFSSEVGSLSEATSQLNTTIGPNTQSNISSLANTMKSLNSDTANITGSTINSLSEAVSNVASSADTMKNSLNQQKDSINNQMYVHSQNATNQFNQAEADLGNVKSNVNQLTFNTNSYVGNVPNSNMNTDLNNVTYPGVYAIPLTINLTNSPENKNIYARLDVKKINHWFSDLIQILYDQSEQCIYFRYRSQATNWHPWEKILNEDDFWNLQNQVNIFNNAGFSLNWNLNDITTPGTYTLHDDWNLANTPYNWTNRIAGELKVRQVHVGWSDLIQILYDLGVNSGGTSTAIFYRYRHQSNNWGNWHRVITNSRLLQNTDLNNLTNTGVYIFSNNITLWSAPSHDMSGFVKVINDMNGDIFQKFCDATLNPQIRVNATGNGGWTPWKSI